MGWDIFKKREEKAKEEINLQYIFTITSLAFLVGCSQINTGANEILHNEDKYATVGCESGIGNTGSWEIINENTGEILANGELWGKNKEQQRIEYERCSNEGIKLLLQDNKIPDGANLKARGESKLK
jgi:hypothetical protein